MEIVNGTLESDRMHRAARAVAQATALDPSADPCAAIRREFDLASDFDCSAWTITVRRGVLPSKLSDALGSASADGTGDMMLVRIDWSRDTWSFPNVFPAANASNNSASPDARFAFRMSQSVSPAASPKAEPYMLRAPFAALISFVRDRRGSASIELAFGAVALIGVSAVCFDLYSRVSADTAVSRMAATMADYVSRDTAPDGAELTALGAFLHERELGVPADVVYVITALRQPAGNPLPAVAVLWSDDSIRVGDATTTAALAGGCARRVTEDDQANLHAALPATFTMAAGEVLVIAEACARLTREGSLTGRFVAGDIYRLHAVPVRDPSNPPSAPA